MVLDHPKSTNLDPQTYPSIIIVATEVFGGWSLEGSIGLPLIPVPFYDVHGEDEILLLPLLNGASVNFEQCF